MPASSKISTRPGSRSAEPAPATPGTVTVAFWLYLVAAVVELVAVVISLVEAAAAHPVASPVHNIAPVNGSAPVTGPGSANAPTGGGVVSSTPAAVEAQLALAIVITAIIAAVAIAALVYFAFRLRRGHAWPRLVLLVLAILAPSDVTHPLGATRLLLVAVATVLVFLTPSVAWFHTMRHRRAVELLSC